MLKSPWRKADDAIFATLLARRGGARYHLIVERLPTDNGWDWTVWRRGDAPELSRHGYSPGLVTAIAAAEAVAQHLGARIAATADA
ncbi:MAG TPA: hypothetical protein VL614_18615 [Acetobacteraceae bacterium]|nr:hypothetical protein [Acetobacteraceae bacterium]